MPQNFFESLVVIFPVCKDATKRILGKKFMCSKIEKKNRVRQFLKYYTGFLYASFLQTFTNDTDCV